MTEVDPLILTLYRSLDLIGVLLNGVIGGTIARKRNFDVVGFIFLALICALGGGMLRDVLMQKGTAAAIADPAYLVLACAGALIAYLTDLRGKKWEYFRVHGDAIVLGVWAVTGAVKAMTYDMPVTSAIFMGVLTAVGGGMIRDVVSGSVPTIFGGGPLYAVPAFLSATLMVVFHLYGADTLGMIICPIVGTALAIISYWRGWVAYRSSEFAPVNMTAAQVRALIRRSEKAGWRKGRLSLRKRKGVFDRDGKPHDNRDFPKNEGSKK